MCLARDRGPPLGRRLARPCVDLAPRTTCPAPPASAKTRQSFLMPSQPPPNPGVVPDPQRLPRKFGPYPLFDRIGTGGMAEILPRPSPDRARRPAARRREADPPQFARTRSSPRCSSTRRSSRALLDHAQHRAGLRPRARRRGPRSSSRWSTSRVSTSNAAPPAAQQKVAAPHRARPRHRGRHS